VAPAKAPPCDWPGPSRVVECPAFPVPLAAVPPAVSAPVDPPHAPPGAANPISEAEVVRTRGLPGFQAFLKQDALGARALFDSDPTFHRAASDMGSFVLAIWAIHLHFTGGLSHRRLRDLGGSGGLVSAGRTTAILWRMQGAGLVRPVSDFRKGARRLYEPTPGIIAGIRARLQLALQAMAPVEPDAGRVAEQLQQHGVFEALIVEVGDGLARAAESPHPAAEPINAFSMKTMAMHFLYSLLEDAYRRGADRPCGRANVSTSALAQRLGVSRAHVVRLRRDLERQGYYERADDGGVITERFAEAYETYVAVGAIGMGRACRNVLARRAEPAATPRPSR